MKNLKTNIKNQGWIKVLNDIIADLKSQWGLTTEEAEDIKLAMASYALAAVHDLAIRQEAMEVCCVEFND